MITINITVNPAYFADTLLLLSFQMEIIRIDNAIQDSLGMLRSVATELGGAGAASNAVEEIVDYLREFKILLILDNLETVLDQRVRDFLSKLP